jgi:hypothetical protein
MVPHLGHVRRRSSWLQEEDTSMRLHEGLKQSKIVVKLVPANLIEFAGTMGSAGIEPATFRSLIASV